MLEAIGATLPNAAAIAISPIPIIAVILMLMSPRAVRLGFSFLVGWLAGILVATTVFTLLTDVLPSGDGSMQTVLGLVQILLGAGLLFLGWKQWRSRPAPGVTPELPSWMSKIDDMGVPAAAGLAFALAALNPKNLLVAAAAGVLIGNQDLDAVPLTIAIIVFSLIAAISVLVPVLFAALAPQTGSRALAGIRAWLTANNAVIMTVLLVILGAKVLGSGIGAL